MAIHTCIIVRYCFDAQQRLCNMQMFLPTGQVAVQGTCAHLVACALVHMPVQVDVLLLMVSPSSAAVHLSTLAATDFAQRVRVHS